MSDTKKVLFLCTGNSCRSQMAEGWAKHLKADVLEAYSAGITSHGLNPRAVQVMEEVDVDISTHESNSLEDLGVCDFDIVFTVCGNANETCPTFPGGKIIHVGFDDPPTLTAEMNDEAEILPVYRRVRDELKSFVSTIEEHF